ncbi:MAG: hypothetical protein LAO20_14795 [Acidobacteriia bacterium]|nr:hypothetical protein [Terriglobia bacterium]
MVALSALWIPILLSAVIVFVASSVIHMAFSFWHAGDYPALPNEEKAMDALRPLAIPPGDYMMPRCKTTQEMKTPAFAEKLKKGPVMVLTVLPNGEWAMGQMLVMWFIYSVVVSFFAAYITGHALHAGSHYLEVFRFVGATAFMGYSLALWQMSIWYRRSWTTTIKATIDGLVYACLTAGTFGWLWPK